MASSSLQTYEAAQAALAQMKPFQMDMLPDELRIESVFVVYMFNDDMTVQVDSAGPSSSYLHIRSASRVGYTDFGVNRRRVKRFLSRLKTSVKSFTSRH